MEVIKMKIEDLPSDIDPEIRPLVEALVERGVNTNYSCQGGPGHESRHPAIGFDVRSLDDATTVKNVLHALGHMHFDINVVVTRKGYDLGCPFGWIRFHEKPKPAYPALQL